MTYYDLIINFLVILWGIGVFTFLLWAARALVAREERKGEERK